MGNGGSAAEARAHKAVFDAMTDARRAEARLRALLDRSRHSDDDKRRLLTSRDGGGRTLLMIACAHACVCAAQILIQEGAQVGVVCNKGWTPLHYACAAKKEDKAEELVSTLLAACADPVVRDLRAQTPFHVAQFNGRLRVLRKLEVRVCDFAGRLCVQAASSFQANVGSVLGETARSTLISHFGSSWKPRWVVISRLRGSKTMARVPQLRCPKCLIFQPRVTDDRRYITCKCGQALIVPPRQRHVINSLAVYSNCNCTLPDAVFNLSDATAQLTSENGLTVIEIRLDAAAAKQVDPIYHHKPRLLETLRATRKRFSVKEPNLIRIASTDAAAIKLAYTALGRKVRTWVEPDQDFTSAAARTSRAAAQAAQSEAAIPVAMVLDPDDDNGLAAAEPASFSSSSDGVLNNTSRRQSSSSHGAPQHSPRSHHPVPPSVSATKVDPPQPAGPPPAQLPPLPSGPWACETCTFENARSSRHCEMCQTPFREASLLSLRHSSASGRDSPRPSSAPVVPPPAPPASPAPPPSPPAAPPSALNQIPSAPSEEEIESHALQAATAASMNHSATTLASRSSSDERHMVAFKCPITHRIMMDPVFTSEGITYERKAIEEWFAKGNTSSPVTGDELSSKTLVPNIALRKAIDHYLCGGQ